MCKHFRPYACHLCIGLPQLVSMETAIPVILLRNHHLEPPKTLCALRLWREKFQVCGAPTSLDTMCQFTGKWQVPGTQDHTLPLKTSTCVFVNVLWLLGPPMCWLCHLWVEGIWPTVLSACNERGEDVSFSLLSESHLRDRVWCLHSQPFVMSESRDCSPFHPSIHR